MINLIKLLIFGHIHEWETVDSAKVTDMESKAYLGTIIHLRCKKCGVYKQQELR